jgi:hypothetical protein
LLLNSVFYIFLNISDAEKISAFEYLFLCFFNETVFIIKPTQFLKGGLLLHAERSCARK